MHDTITLLSPHGSIATKCVYPDRSEPPPQAKWNRALVAPVQDLASFVSVLQTLAPQPNWFAVRGAPKDGLDFANMRRTHLEPDATLVERPRRWVLLDLDKVMLEVPAATFAADPRKYAIAARALLPPCFRTVACWFQATGSAGVKPGVRLRLGFWLDRPTSSAEWRQWTESWDVEIDRTLFTPSQPHYTAGPVFLEGAQDPVKGERWGVLEGASEQAQVPVMVSDRPELDAADAALRVAVRKLAKVEAGERNESLNRVAFSLGKRFHADDLPSDKICTALIKAMAAWGIDIPDHHTTDTLTRAIRDGRARREREHDGWRERLARDPGKDEVKTMAANVSIYLEHHEVFCGRLAMEQGAALWVAPPPWREGIGPYTEADTAHAVEWFSTAARMDVRPSWVEAGVHKAASLNPVNALTNWLGTLPTWDATQRAETLFIRYLGAEDSAYVRAATRVWLLQARGRAHATLERPYKADHTVVLRGPQGVGKSTVLGALAPSPRYFLDHLPDLRDKDARLALGRAWIVELAELTQRTADKDVFKAFLTSTVDSVRRPYGRDVVDIPRRCVFAASVNDSEFLTDATGARRFLPIECKGSGIEAAQVGRLVAEEREQLWAEVMSWPEDELPILPAHAQGQAERAREHGRVKGAAEELLCSALSKPPGGMAVSTFHSNDLTQHRCVRRITAAQATELIGWSTLRLREVKDALRCIGWVADDSGNVTKYTAPASWAYEVSEGYVARSN